MYFLHIASSRKIFLVRRWVGPIVKVMKILAIETLLGSILLKGFPDKNSLYWNFCLDETACLLSFTNFMFVWRILQKLTTWSYLFASKKIQKSKYSDFWKPLPNLGSFFVNSLEKWYLNFTNFGDKFQKTHKKNRTLVGFLQILPQYKLLPR